MMPRSLLVLLIAAAALACQPMQSPPATDHQADLEALANQARAFSAAYMAGDVDAMMDIYTEEGVIFPDNAEYIKGQEALRRYWTLPEGRRITHHELMPVEVEISGDMASDYGHYVISGENNGVAWGPVHGKYLVVWKRGADGQWRMQLDMWNSRPQQEG